MTECLPWVHLCCFGAVLTIAFLAFTLPWLNVGLTINNLWQTIVSNHLATTYLVTVYSTVTNAQIWCLGLLCIASVILLILQWQIRQRLKNVMNLSANYWLSGLGGLLIASIALVFWVKTETGWGLELARTIVKIRMIEILETSITSANCIQNNRTYYLSVMSKEYAAKD